MSEAKAMLEKLLQGQHLTESEAGDLMRTLAEGTLEPAQAGALLAALLPLTGCEPPSSTPVTRADYLGSAVCADCHLAVEFRGGYLPEPLGEGAVRLAVVDEYVDATEFAQNALNKTFECLCVCEVAGHGTGRAAIAFYLPRNLFERA